MEDNKGVICLTALEAKKDEAGRTEITATVFISYEGYSVKSDITFAKHNYKPNDIFEYISKTFKGELVPVGTLYSQWVGDTE